MEQLKVKVNDNEIKVRPLLEDNEEETNDDTKGFTIDLSKVFENIDKENEE